MFTPAQRRAFGEGLAQSNRVLNLIENLERAAHVLPSHAQQIADLRTKRQALYEMTSTLLQIDREATGNGS